MNLGLYHHFSAYIDGDAQTLKFRDLLQTILSKL